MRRATRRPVADDHRGRHRRRRLGRASRSRAGAGCSTRPTWSSAARRHLALLPGHARRQHASRGRRRCATTCPRCSNAHRGRDVVALASGDPLVSGIGTTLIALLGDGRRTHRAGGVVGRAGPGPDGLVGRDQRRRDRRRPGPARRPARARARSPGPGAVVRRDAPPPSWRELLAERGVRRQRDDRARRPRRGRGVPASTRRPRPGPRPAPALNVIALELRGPVGRRVGRRAARRRLRARRPAHQARPARLRPGPARAAARPAAVGRRRRRRLGRHRVDARAPDAAGRSRSSPTPTAPRGSRATPRGSGVPGLRRRRRPRARRARRPARPDAVFVGGGATAPGLLDACRERAAPGGRLVVHGVTLETEPLLAAAYAEHGGELTRMSVEHAAPIGVLHRLDAGPRRHPVGAASRAHDRPLRRRRPGRRRPAHAARRRPARRGRRGASTRAPTSTRPSSRTAATTPASSTPRTSTSTRSSRSWSPPTRPASTSSG